MQSMNQHPVARWAQAFVQGTRYSSAKYHVEALAPAPRAPVPCYGEAYFHRNRVAWRDAQGVLWLSACGWDESPTTVSRLNAILDAIGHPGKFFRAGRKLWLDEDWNSTPSRVRYVGASEHIPLVGRLGALALKHARAA